MASRAVAQALVVLSAGAVLSGMLVVSAGAGAAHARGTRCVGQARGAERVDRGIAPVVGTGPVRATAVSRRGVTFGAPLPSPLDRWLASKVLWVVRRDQGAVAIEGRRRDTGELVRWSDGTDRRLLTSAAHLDTLSTRLEDTPAPLPDSAWSHLPSGPIYPGPGCYVFTIQGDTTTTELVLRARVSRP